MKIIDFIKIHAGIMKLLSNYSVKMDDFKHVSMFDDYDLMIKNGNKVSYVVKYLSEKYNMSEASVYRLLKKFKATL